MGSFGATTGSVVKMVSKRCQARLDMFNTVMEWFPGPGTNCAGENMVEQAEMTVHLQPAKICRLWDKSGITYESTLIPVCAGNCGATQTDVLDVDFTSSAPTAACHAVEHLQELAHTF